MTHSLTKIFSKKILFVLTLCALSALLLFAWTQKSQAIDQIAWGVDFSESQAVYLGLDPRETYSAIIHDLGAKNIKIHINWDTIETAEGTYDFSTLDTEVKEAERNHVKLILVVGMKTGRWPECHLPQWFTQLPEDKRQDELLSYVSTLVQRYRSSRAVQYWQVENEPTVRFGICPSWYYAHGTTLLEDEVSKVRSDDPSRKIIISDSGELSTWTGVAPTADIVGITMYRSSWNGAQKTFGINPYAFLTPSYYSTKAAYIRMHYGKPVISIELQAEPWASKPLREASIAEQEKSMNPKLFEENIAFAKAAGLRSYYFWGAEWWYSMKTDHGKPEIWNEAKQLFAE